MYAISQPFFIASMHIFLFKYTNGIYLIRFGLDLIIVKHISSSLKKYIGINFIKFPFSLILFNINSLSNKEYNYNILFFIIYYSPPYL